MLEQILVWRLEVHKSSPSPLPAAADSSPGHYWVATRKSWTPEQRGVIWHSLHSFSSFIQFIQYSNIFKMRLCNSHYILPPKHQSTPARGSNMLKEHNFFEEQRATMACNYKPLNFSHHKLQKTRASATAANWMTCSWRYIISGSRATHSFGARLWKLERCPFYSMNLFAVLQHFVICSQDLVTNAAHSLSEDIWYISLDVPGLEANHLLDQRILRLIYWYGWHLAVCPLLNPTFHNSVYFTSFLTGRSIFSFMFCTSRTHGNSFLETLMRMARDQNHQYSGLCRHLQSTKTVSSVLKEWEELMSWGWTVAFTDKIWKDDFWSVARLHLLAPRNSMGITWRKPFWWHLLKGFNNHLLLLLDHVLQPSLKNLKTNRHRLWGKESHWGWQVKHMTNWVPDKPLTMMKPKCICLQRSTQSTASGSDRPCLSNSGISWTHLSLKLYLRHPWQDTPTLFPRDARMSFKPTWRSIQMQQIMGGSKAFPFLPPAGPGPWTKNTWSHCWKRACHEDFGVLSWKGCHLGHLKPFVTGSHSNLYQLRIQFHCITFSDFQWHPGPI